jgi:hypothetical protein
MKNKKYSHQIWKFYSASSWVYNCNRVGAGPFIVIFFMNLFVFMYLVLIQIWSLIV